MRTFICFFIINQRTSSLLYPRRLIRNFPILLHQAMTWDSDATKGTSRKRQCWECARRRLVCDSTRPSCTKCTKSGVECPGYGQKKPLKWLKPGQVNSQRGRRRATEGKERPKHVEVETKSVVPGMQVSTMHISLARVKDACAAQVDLIPRFDLIEETAEIVHSIHYCKPHPGSLL